MIKIILILTFAIELFAIKDMLGRDIQIEKVPSRVLAIGPGSLRLLKYLNIDVVAIENIEKRLSKKTPYSLAYSNRIKNLKVFSQGGVGKLPNIERVIELKPDIIISNMFDREAIDSLSEKLKTPIFAISYGNGFGGGEDKKLNSILKSLNLLSKIFKKEDRFAEISNFIKSTQSEFENLEINSTIYIGGLGYKGVQGLFSTELDFIPFEILNLKNLIIKDSNGHKFMQKEALLKFNPEYIFIDEFSQEVVKAQLKKDVYLTKYLNAFKNEKIFYLFANNFYNTNLENTLINSYLIYSKVANSEIDLNSKIREILKIFYPNEYGEVLKLYDNKFLLVQPQISIKL